MSYSIDKSSEFVRVTYVGSLDNNDIQGVLKDSLMKEGDDLRLTNRIEDMRQLHGIKIGFDELMDFTNSLRAIQLPMVVKSAILTNNMLQYGIARMFQTILEHPQMVIKIFSDEEKAYQWLSGDE
jgi:hypothetical protein